MTKTHFAPGEEPADAIPVIIAKELARRGNKELVVIVALNRRTMQMEYTEFANAGYEMLVDKIIEAVDQRVKSLNARRKSN